MPGHPHIIKRHVVDLRIDSRLDSSQIQERVSETLKDDLLPVIDEYLNTIDSREETYRIDYLEVDLGVIRADQIEQQLKERLVSQLGNKALKAIPFTDNIATPDSDSKARDKSDFALIAYFLNTGTLPWWVKENSSAVLKDTVDNLLGGEDGNIFTFFKSVTKNSTALKRLILFCDDTLLYKIIAKTAPRYKVTPDQQRLLLAAFTSMVPIGRFRQVWWTTVLQGALWHSELLDSPQPLVKLFFEVMGQEERRYISPVGENLTMATLLEFYNKQVGTLNMILAVLLGVEIKNSKSLSEQLESLTRLIESHNAFSTIRHSIKGFTTTSTDKPGPTEKDYEVSPAEVINVQLMLNSLRKFFRLQPVSYPTIEIAGKGSSIIPNKTTSELENASPDLTGQVDKTTINTKADNSVNLSSKVVDKAKKSIPSLNVDDKNGISARSQDGESLTGDHLQVRSNEHEIYPPSDLYQDDTTEQLNNVGLTDPFSETDKLYIADAGLVLLAPFLTRFFKNISLSDGKNFIDPEASEKACLLLQYVAQGSQWEPFEPHLVLNKLLCGIELHHPVDVQLEITQDQLDAADELLAAVMANAPLWKTLSFEGLRKAYLQREGILSSRDGNWLLQVKREAYDILVDRLPWSTRVVKLPWMKNLIFVEWQLD